MATWTDTWTDTDSDVLVIGSGLLGASVARMVREARPDATVTMVAGGPRMGAVPGQHLHDSPDEALRRRFAAGAAVNQQNLYAGADRTTSAAVSRHDLTAGLYGIEAVGNGPGDLPGAAVAWNEGGMGVHWAAGTPPPFGDEVPVMVDDEFWPADLRRAQTLLGVGVDAFPGDDRSAAILRVLSEQLGGHGAAAPQRMPMAIARRPDGVLVRTGPNRIWPPLADHSDPGFTLLDATVCTGLAHRDGRVEGAFLSSLRDGSDTLVRARQVVVAADALRTPQLLFASGIRPPALGRFLNEHAFLSGAVIVTPEMLGLPPWAADAPSSPDEPFRHALWVPYRGSERPFHGGVLCRPTSDGPAGSLLVTLSWYVPADVSADNRMVFADDDDDATGLPRFSVRFTRSDADTRRTAEATAVLHRVALALTDGRSDTPCALLEPGSSLHYTGTVRMSAADDGTGVCDPTGRVWGFDNLYLAGNGVIPSALAANSTLTAVAVAVRTVRRLTAALA